MENSQYLANANKLISSIKGKLLTVEERREAAIELATLILNESRRIQTSKEHRKQAQMNRMMEDSGGKALTAMLTDECFRSKDKTRIADQIIYLIETYGVPTYLSYFWQFQCLGLRIFAHRFPKLFVPLIKAAIRRQTGHVIIPGEHGRLAKHLDKRWRQKVRVNLNRIGEEIVGEREAAIKMQQYLDDLANPEIESISVKVSTLYSQLHLIAWETILAVLTDRLKTLFRAARQHTFVRPSGIRVEKFVNLDMEEYRDLHLTVELFRKVMDDPEFHQHAAGIVLQSYLPESYLIQQELTVWAMQRIASGGAPIKIRIVKGANLAMEKVQASLQGWQQAPYLTKAETDANFKRMLLYACTPEHAQAAKIGVGSHNLFDIAYALVMRAEFGVESDVEFEMLEGMAESMSRVVQQLSNGMLLYCPAAKENEFHHAVAYFVRRLDENTAPDNFLRYLFGMMPGTKEWQTQANQFSLSCHAAHSVSKSPRRTQNRFITPLPLNPDSFFVNEPDTDWALPQNRKWIQGIIAEWKNKTFEDVPLVINGKKLFPEGSYQIGKDPSRPGKELYRFRLAEGTEVETALRTAENVKKQWMETAVEERSKILVQLANLLRQNRGELIGAMIADAGKIAEEADTEVSEAIDFVEYYRRNLQQLAAMKDLHWDSRGTVLVTPPWNFPCSIPLGGVIAALACGSCVIFKPALETAYIGWKLAQLCWKAGFSQDVLQLIFCKDDPLGSQLVQDSRIASVILTGETETAKKFLQMRPELYLLAESGGKNALIITKLSDRDLAVRDLVQSAFGHAGQKCSACSLAICESEVYDDPLFRKTLKSAAASLKVGPAWDLATQIPPLMREPNSKLQRSLTTLEEGEEWLLKPEQDPKNPLLWSPGIKLGVTKESFTHQTELFGPVLGLMKAKNLDEAVTIANGTRYGLTSGIHSLDEREQRQWMNTIEAGNCYVNRTITGAIVRRQPFGGCKQSNFGPGGKAGGPNYLKSLLAPKQVFLPQEHAQPSGNVNVLTLHLKKLGISGKDQEVWQKSIGSYAYYWNQYFSKEHDPDKIIGQDNILKYVPLTNILFRINSQDSILDVCRVIAAAMTCHARLQLSSDTAGFQPLVSGDWIKLTDNLTVVEESEEAMAARIAQNVPKRVRLISSPSHPLMQALAKLGCSYVAAAPLANGRVELFRYLREVSLSINYHRYGYLGLRETEQRAKVM